MATVINAQTSAGGLSITPDLSGQIALQSNGTTVATMNSTTLSVPNGIGGIPAFSYFASTDQAIATATATKVTYPTSLYDTTGGMYNSSTSRFTPTVAGYYQVIAFFEYYSSSSTAVRDIYIYKNGGLYRRGQQQTAATNANTTSLANAIVFLNGSTDYLEIYAYQSTGSSLSIANSNGQSFNGFEACLMRSQ